MYIVEWRYSYAHSLPRHYIKESVQFYVITVLPHPEALSTYPKSGWVGPRVEEGVLGKK
jgi:hypothetical protein